MSGEGGSITEVVRLADVEQARALSGRRDEHLRRLREAFGVQVVLRGEQVALTGREEAVLRAAAAIRALLREFPRGGPISASALGRAISGEEEKPPPSRGGVEVDVMVRGRTVRPKSSNQAAYLQAIADNDLVFCAGPAGTGKTYLAVAMAVNALKHGRVRKLILTRPAVEAGERLGFLPGDFQAKINPYLRPLYDAISDMMSWENLRRYMENDLIEVAPLAYMRGRTLDHAFVILDEGQNCTQKQMKMFLTRLGPASKCVVTGDVTQTDLPVDQISGMMEAASVLKGVRGIAFVTLTPADVVRHRLVQDIVQAYEIHERSRLPGEPPEGPERAR